jgi:hypothetical protein
MRVGQREEFAPGWDKDVTRSMTQERAPGQELGGAGGVGDAVPSGSVAETGESRY